MLSPTTRFVSESSARCAGMLRRNDTWRLVFFSIIVFFGAFPLGCFAATTPGVEGLFFILFYFIFFFGAFRWDA
jgi:hypothetical protein